MSRTRAAGATVAVMAGCAALGYCLDRWPGQTVAAVAAVSVYLQFRAGECDDRAAGETGS